MNLHPLADRVVAQQVEAETKTASGFLLPPAGGEKPPIAVVLAVGKDVTEVKVGDKILFSKADFKLVDELKVEGKDVVVLKEAAIVAIVKGK
jgi:chaperonin GroES